MQALEKDQPVYSLRTMDDVVMNSLGTRRVSMQLFTVFAIAALLLAAVGIYGVMAYSVTQRTQEIGIRIALGAKRSDILRMAMAQGLRMTLVGLGVGLVVSLGAKRALRAALFGVTSTLPGGGRFAGRHHADCLLHSRAQSNKGGADGSSEM